MHNMYVEDYNSPLFAFNAHNLEPFSSRMILPRK